MNKTDLAISALATFVVLLRLSLPWLIANAPRLAKLGEVLLEVLPDLLGAAQKAHGVSPVSALNVPVAPQATGQDLYNAYCQSSGGVNYLGEPCPEWADLPDPVKTNWAAVAVAKLTAK